MVQATNLVKNYLKQTGDELAVVETIRALVCQHVGRGEAWMQHVVSAKADAYCRAFVVSLSVE